MITKLQAKAKSDPISNYMSKSKGIVQRSCSDCPKKRRLLKRRAVRQAGPAAVPPIVHEVLRSPGRPLDAATRGLMESRFSHDFSRVRPQTVPQAASLTIGPANDRYEQEADRVANSVMQSTPSQKASANPRYDFSHVRVHDDARSAESAQAMSASAYTVGNNIVFGESQYSPGVTAGQRLLAHELTHVVQQGSRVHNSIQCLTKEEKKQDLKSDRLKSDSRLQKAFDNDPSMKIQETSEGVKTLQRALKDLGYLMPISFRKTGDADGIFGDETRSTVKHFQSDNDLDVDGVAGRETLGGLDRLYNRTPGGGPGTQAEPRSAPDIIDLKTLRPGLTNPNWWVEPKALVMPIVFGDVVPSMPYTSMPSFMRTIDLKGEVAAEVKLLSEGDATDPCRSGEISTQYLAKWKLKGYSLGERMSIMSEISGSVKAPAGCSHLPEWEMATTLFNYDVIPRAVQFTVKPVLTFGDEFKFGVAAEAEFKPWGGAKNILGQITLSGGLDAKSQIFGETGLFSPFNLNAILKASYNFTAF